MIYRDNYANKKPAEPQLQPYLPVTGAFGCMNSTPQYQSIQSPMMHNGTAAPTGAIPMPITTPSTPTQVHGVMPTSTAYSGNQVPSTVENTFFTPGFLRTQIGQRMRVEFLIGTNMLTDRTGTLVAVGASYIVLKLIDADDLMMCDIYSIKFVTIIL
jgi:hypothetical protein